MTTLNEAHAQYLFLTDALKRLPGEVFEDHRHPAVVLDRATKPSVRVWGWWTDGASSLPCLLWSTELGWSATVVGPDGVDAPGYDLRFWTHRIRLLDIALANASHRCPATELEG